MTKRHLVVVGGGISGLVAAHHLLTVPGVGVTLLDASPQVGGKLRLSAVTGLELDAGAESVLARRVEFRELVDDLGLGDRLIPPAANGVEILIDGQRRRLPSSQLLGIPYDFAELAASGVLDDVGLARARDDASLPPTSFGPDVSVGELVRARMGQQVVDRLVEPLLAGVYATSADMVSTEVAIPGLLAALSQDQSLATAAASLVAARESPRGFVSLEGGLGTLTARLGERVSAAPNGELLTSAPVISIWSQSDGWIVGLEHDGVAREISADGLLLAVPATVAGSLVADVSPGASRLLADIDYASVVLTTLVFEPSKAPTFPSGTGMLVPPSEGMLTKAVTFTSQKWQWVADVAQGRVVIRVSMGRADDVRALTMSDPQLVDVVCHELSSVLSQPVRPLASEVVRWERAIPQYAVGHRSRVNAIRGKLADLGGFEVCGAWVEGVGIPTCIATAQQAATRLVDQLS